MLNKLSKIKRSFRHYISHRFSTIRHLANRKNKDDFGCYLNEIKLPVMQAANLASICLPLNHLLIKPKERFSFWHCLKSTDTAGLKNESFEYLTDALFYLFLNGPFKIIERHAKEITHCSYASASLKGIETMVIKDALDLKAKSIADYPIEINIFVENNYLFAALKTKERPQLHYRVVNKNLKYPSIDHEQFETVDIYRQTIAKEKILHEEKLYTNVSRSLYGI